MAEVAKNEGGGSLMSEIASILGRAQQRHSNSDIDELLRPITSHREQRPVYKGSNSLQQRVTERVELSAESSLPHGSPQSVAQAHAQAAAAGARPSTVAAALQSSPHFRSTALTASPPSKPYGSILAMSSTPMRSSMSGITGSPMTAASNGSNISAVPSPPGPAPRPTGRNFPLATVFHRSTESCPGYPTARQAFLSEEGPLMLRSPSGRGAALLGSGPGAESMRSRRTTTPGIAEASMMAAMLFYSKQDHSGSILAQHPLQSVPSATPLPDQDAGDLAPQASFNQLLPAQPSFSQLLNEDVDPRRSTGGGAGTRGGGISGDRRSRKSRRSSEADEPSQQSVPFEAPPTHTRSQANQFTFGPAPVTIPTHDSPPRASVGAGHSLSSGATSPAGASAPSPTGPSPTGGRALLAMGSVRARAPIMSILQQSPAKKEPPTPVPQQQQPPARQLSYTHSLSLKGQQEFLKQQKAEQEALDKQREEQDRRQKELQEKAEQEQFENDVQLFTNPRRALGYSPSMATHPGPGMVSGRSADAAAAAAIAAVDQPAPAAPAAASPVAERALGHTPSMLIRQQSRGAMNPLLATSFARGGPAAVPPARASAPAGGVLPPPVPVGPGLAPTVSRLAAAATGVVPAVRPVEDGDADVANKNEAQGDQLLAYEAQLLQQKLAEIALRKQQQHVVDSEAALVDSLLDDNASTDREEEEAPPPPSEFVLRWVEENNIRMSQKLRGRG